MVTSSGRALRRGGGEHVARLLRPLRLLHGRHRVRLGDLALQVLALLAPYEDVIADGSLADANITGATGCIVSAIQGLGGTVLLGVTPLNASAPLSFGFRGAGSGAHALVDLASGKTLQHVAGAQFEFAVESMPRSAVLRFARDEN